MTWREMQSLMRDSYEVAVEVGSSRNKYWIRKGQLYFPILSFQFDRLLEEGYINPDYKINRGSGPFGDNLYIYEGR